MYTGNSEVGNKKMVEVLPHLKRMTSWLNDTIRLVGFITLVVVGGGVRMAGYNYELRLTEAVPGESTWKVSVLTGAAAVESTPAAEGEEPFDVDKSVRLGVKSKTASPR